MFCDICGETNPPNGFFALGHSHTFGGEASLSGITCNECYLSDEEYLETFGETKEEARKRVENEKNKVSS